MNMEDEYFRDYVFEPEFIQRKDCPENHLGLDKSLMQSQSFSRKLKPKDNPESSTSDEDLKLTFIEAEVYSFSSVNIQNVLFLVIHALTLESSQSQHLKNIYVVTVKTWGKFAATFSFFLL